MRLIPVPITDEGLAEYAVHWLPFLPMIARRTKEAVPVLYDRIMRREVRLALVWDDAIRMAVALAGVRLHYRGQDLIAEWIWMAGRGRQQWQHLLPELEQLLRAAGCVECRPLCRPGWAKILKAAGYKLTHVQMEKTLEKSNG
jgi:hypothetical protein